MIYVSHGIVNSHSPRKFCHQFLLDRKKFKIYIRHKPNKYVSIENALDGKGEALTIDDATYASYDAAKLLKKYGHEVTFFINPFYIEHKIDYWFLKLNFFLDASSQSKINFNNKEYLLSTYQNKLIFRNELKTAIAGLSTEEEKHKVLEIIFKINTNNVKIPFYLKTISESDVLELYRLGVNIQNHGWTHRQLKEASENDIKNEIMLGKEWIHKKIQHEPGFYAVPFGDLLPSDNLQHFTYCFLSKESITPGFQNKKVYNRSGFKLIS